MTEKQQISIAWKKVFIPNPTQPEIGMDTYGNFINLADYKIPKSHTGYFITPDYDGSPLAVSYHFKQDF